MIKIYLFVGLVSSIKQDGFLLINEDRGLLRDNFDFERDPTDFINNNRFYADFDPTDVLSTSIGIID